MELPPIKPKIRKIVVTFTLDPATKQKLDRVAEIYHITRGDYVERALQADFENDSV
jgi:predicted transcriptional regulator